MPKEEANVTANTIASPPQSANVTPVSQKETTATPKQENKAATDLPPHLRAKLAAKSPAKASGSEQAAPTPETTAAPAVKASDVKAPAVQQAAPAPTPASTLYVKPSSKTPSSPIVAPPTPAFTFTAGPVQATTASPKIPAAPAVQPVQAIKPVEPVQPTKPVISQAGSSTGGDGSKLNPIVVNGDEKPKKSSAVSTSGDEDLTKILKSLQKDVTALTKEVGELATENTRLNSVVEGLLKCEERRKGLGTDSAKVPFEVNVTYRKCSAAQSHC
jgi:hypothetical protein